jgi:hypothetical protein
MTVRELLSRIDSHELAEWMAYYSLDPFGTARADLSAGIIAATVANANKGKKGRPFQPADFMPYTEKREQTESDMIQILNSMVKKGN